MTSHRIFNRRHILALATLLATAGGAAASAAVAEGPPQDPVTIVVGYNKGGSVDLVARTVAEAWAPILARPVVVQNIAGASGMLGAVQVGLASPSSSMLLLGSPSEIGINSSLDRRIRFDPVKDTTPLVLVGGQPMVLVAAPRLRITDTAGFVDYASKTPGIRFASSGRGTPLHLAGELINQRAGLKMQHVPLSGAGPMVEELLAGRVDFAVLVLSSALPYLRDGRLQAIGLTTPARNRIAPTIPALAEDPRFKGLDIGVWFGVLGPPRMAAARADELRRQLRAVLQLAPVRAKLEASGLTLAENTDFEPFLRAEIKKFRSIAEAGGLAQ